MRLHIHDALMQVRSHSFAILVGTTCRLAHATDVPARAEQHNVAACVRSGREIRFAFRAMQKAGQ